MDTPKPSDTDWRQHLHCLPSGEKPFPRFLVWIFLVPFLAIAGGLVLLVCGGFLALTFGFGPDDGGAMFTLFGLIANLVIGLAIALFGKRRGYSVVACRVAFYVFMLPAFLIIFYDAWRYFAR